MRSTVLAVRADDDQAGVVLLGLVDDDVRRVAMPLDHLHVDSRVGEPALPLLQARGELFRFARLDGAHATRTGRVRPARP